MLSYSYMTMWPCLCCAILSNSGKERLEEEKDGSISDIVKYCDIYYGNNMITSETAIYCKLLIGVSSVPYYLSHDQWVKAA